MDYKATFFGSGSETPAVLQNGNDLEVIAASSAVPTVEAIPDPDPNPDPDPTAPDDIYYRTPSSRDPAEHLWQIANHGLQILQDRAIFDSAIATNSPILKHCVLSMGIDSNGDIFAAAVVRDEHAAPSIYEGSGYVVAKSSDNGDTWQQVSRVPSGGDTKKPLLVPTPDGSFNVVFQQKDDNFGESWYNPNFPKGSHCMNLAGQLLATHATYGQNSKIRKFYGRWIMLPVPGGEAVGLYDRIQQRWFTTTDGGATITMWPDGNILKGPIQNERAYLFQGDTLWAMARNGSIHSVEPPYAGNSWTQRLPPLGTHVHDGLDCIEFNGKVYMACRHDEGGTHWSLNEVSLQEPFGYTEILRIDNVGSDGGYSSLCPHPDGQSFYALYNAVKPTGWNSKEHVPYLMQLALQ